MEFVDRLKEPVLEMQKLASTLVLAISVALFAPLRAEDSVLIFAPAQTGVHWTLGALLHTVHGTFRLKAGSIHFDRATGKASGEIVIDALSGESGNSSRDSKMHSNILESKIFHQIVFRPDHVSGQIPTQGPGKLQVHGTFELLSKPHEFTLPVELQVDAAQIAVKSEFHVPYIQWGLKNPSTFMLKVDDNVLVDITASARVEGQGTH